MSVASAIRGRDAAALPGKRDEDWRWTDLRGLIRQVPEPSTEIDPATVVAGPFDALAEDAIVVANGQGAAHIGVEPGETKVVAL
ncbi:MAG TPA: Fe-S cluster assembly protein SufD, partial [Planctomycetota bacterium]|nr:Fe-S cluster assembly protein SufD [Planctomycetota bacterium]